MNVLVVDDQVNVLKGIETGVHFQELGVNQVFFANDSAHARGIIASETVDIVLSDIEMPGEDGISLISWILKAYPDILCIMLTSHADFRYAQVSIQLGCFDYLLQPAPYEQIESCLHRALQVLYERRKRSQIYTLGQLLKTNETEMMNHVISSIFSRNHDDKVSALSTLNAIGYPVFESTPMRTVVIVVQSFSRAESSSSEKAIHKAILEAVKLGGITYPIIPLSHTNPFREFCLTLFCTNQEIPDISAEAFQSFYQRLTQMLPGDKIMCYVGKCIPLSAAREEYRRIRKTLVEENIGRRPGLYLRPDEKLTSIQTVNLTECITRWKVLLQTGNKRMLETEIEAFIHTIEDSSRNKHKDLCELHQHLTHIFFSYLYDHNADIAELFTPEYTYMDYMDCFASVQGLREGMQYMLNALDALQSRNVPMSDVEKARTYIAENITNPITVTSVSEHVNLSAEYFTKLFKRETGQNIKEYILQSKISAAKDMLDHSNMSISMIALELGYSNFSHFTQVFKKYEKVTPSEYRKMAQNAEEKPEDQIPEPEQPI